jgi:truncated hemoglobin YjbI
LNDWIVSLIPSHYAKMNNDPQFSGVFKNTLGSNNEAMIKMMMEEMGRLRSQITESERN